MSLVQLSNEVARGLFSDGFLPTPPADQPTAVIRAEQERGCNNLATGTLIAFSRDDAGRALFSVVSHGDPRGASEREKDFLPLADMNLGGSAAHQYLGMLAGRFKTTHGAVLGLVSCAALEAKLEMLPGDPLT